MTAFPPRASGRIPRIAIVGGGPGGLLTAYFLLRFASRPIRITLFEAGRRLGGKVLTPSFATAAVRYEAGAAELYDYTPVGDDPLRDLVAELGLATVPLGGATVVVAGETVANLDDLAAAFGADARRAVEGFDRDARGAMTPREFYASDEAPPAGRDTFATRLDRVGHPAARHYLETLIHSDLATEPDRTNVPYGLQNYLMNDPAYMRLYGIAGGNEQLVAALAARIDAEVRLDAAVTEVRPIDDGYRLGVRRGDVAGPFDAVVLALPLQHLAGVAVAEPGLAAALGRHVDRFDHPAHYLRVSCLFAEPFWGGLIEGGYLMLDAFGGCCLYDESAREPEARHGVLGWLLGGAAAEHWAAQGDGPLVEAALDALPEAFGDARRHLLEARVHRWTGAVSSLPGGWRPPGIDRRHQPDPAGHPLVFVVGDYLYDSTLNGVLDSAEHVAGWLAADLA
ncbi:MAG: flavin monoamine oxidase family protein [Planctomycetaceae bacterium]